MPHSEPAPDRRGPLQRLRDDHKSPAIAINFARREPDHASVPSSLATKLVPLVARNQYRPPLPQRLANAEPPVPHHQAGALHEPLRLVDDLHGCEETAREAAPRRDDLPANRLVQFSPTSYRRK